MSAEEGMGYLSPLSYQCLFRPAFDNIRASHSNTPEAVDAINALQSSFRQADQDSPSFLFDLTKILITESKFNINIQESYLRMQANAPTDDLELPELAQSVDYSTISQRAISLRRVLARIPSEMADRRAFLETIREIATSIRDLLDVANQIIKTVPQSVHPILERRKREFVRYSKQFSNTLKEYFRDQNASQVFIASNLLIFQTIQLIRCIRERIVKLPASSNQHHEASHLKNGSK